MGGNGFLTWFSTWGQVIYIIAQIGFWAALAVAAVVVAREYTRLVRFKTGERSTQRAPGAASAEPLPAVVSATSPFSDVSIELCVD